MTIDIKKVGIVGAGVMGGGIAQVSATGGLQVVLYDVAEGAAVKAVDTIAARLNKRASEGKMPVQAAQDIIGRMQAAQSLEDLADCDLVVEAVVEKLDVKLSLFRQLEAVVSPNAILASNTSSLPIGAIAAGCEHKQRIAGLHFFNPVPLMKLVEVIPGPQTPPEVIESLLRVSRVMGREPVQVKDSPGFLVNFGGRAYPTEALAITHENIASPAQVDAIMRDVHGFRMGPFELMDLTGIDVNFPVTHFIHERFFGDARLRSTPQHQYLLETAQLGRKTGQGFYDYSGSSSQPVADTAVDVDPATVVCVPDSNPVLLDLVRLAGATAQKHDDGHSPILVAPLGEDCTAYAVRWGIDHERLVAVDTLGQLDRRLTLMCAPGVNAGVRDSVIAMFQNHCNVSLIADSAGFVGQRIVAMVVNLGCEMAQIGIATPHDIDRAMRLGLNYPMGPFEMAEHYGTAKLHGILTTLHDVTGDDRYRPSQWLRRRALLKLAADAQ